MKTVSFGVSRVQHRKIHYLYFRTGLGKAQELRVKLQRMHILHFGVQFLVFTL